jgi:hypothetical protein
MTAVMIDSRHMWRLYEPIHAVIYFSAEARAVTDALGMRGFWMGYFALRSAPLGEVEPAVVLAAFYGFAPERVRRALPDAWRYATAGQALEARLDAANHALTAARVVAAVQGHEMGEAAELAWAAAESADVAGRVLGAANQSLKRPDAAHLALWQALTTLREHRGDGHHAVLVAHGIGPVAAHLLKTAAGEADGEVLRSVRGFPDEAWVAGAAELQRRGWLDGEGILTQTGRSAKQAIEDATDAASQRPWTVLGAGGTERLAELLAPMARAVVSRGAVPYPNPIGVARPA